MLSLRAVNQFYGNQHTLWNVDLDLPQGLMHRGDWPARHGKNHLINCITGALPVQSGNHHVWHEAGAPPCDLPRQAPINARCRGLATCHRTDGFFQLTIEEKLAHRHAGRQGQRTRVQKRCL